MAASGQVQASPVQACSVAAAVICGIALGRWCAKSGTGSTPTVRSFAENAALSAALGKAVAEASVAAARRGKPFTVAISGGSLPKLLAAGLLHVPGIDYSSWRVFFADERVVPLEDDSSNYKACNEALFTRAGSGASKLSPNHIYTVDPSLSAKQAADAYSKELQAVFGVPSSSTPEFDLVLLGMGPDGHTASLFPGHALLDVSDCWVAHIEDSPKPPPKRITLTLPVINAARQVFFVCTGAAKAPKLAVALGVAEGSVPAGLVKPTNGEVVWFVDDAASADYRAALERENADGTSN